jgi:predicted phosphodiesterase
MNGNLDQLIDQQEKQTILDRLDGLLKASPLISWTSQSKGLVISDLHQGNGGKADDYKKNAQLVNDTVSHYCGLGYVIIGAGDIKDGWKFDFKDIKYTQPAFDYLIQGNHDRALNLYPESIILTNGVDKILIDHGYAGETTTDVGWKTSRWFIRHVVMPAEAAGIISNPDADPRPSINHARHDMVVNTRHEWAFERKQILCYGHIHSGWEDRPYIFNSDCCIHDGVIGALIIEGYEIHFQQFT